MKHLNRKLRTEICKGVDYTKAIAFSILVKQVTVSSTVKNWNPNKLYNLTGVHPDTVKKHMAKLAEMNLIEEHPDGTVVFKSLTDRRETRNMPSLEFDEFHTLKDIEYAIYTVVLMDIIMQKEYVKEMLDIRFDAKWRDDFRGARKVCRKHHYDKPYEENGIAYEGLAAILNVSKGTAEKVIDFATSHNFVEKHNRQIQVYNQGIRFLVTDMRDFLAQTGATFCTKNNIYKVLANTYTIVPPELHKYVVDTTDAEKVEIPKWQTAENLADERMKELSGFDQGNGKGHKRRCAKKTKTENIKDEKACALSDKKIENIENRFLEKEKDKTIMLNAYPNATTTINTAAITMAADKPCSYGLR